MSVISVLSAFISKIESVNRIRYRIIHPVMYIKICHIRIAYPTATYI